MFAFCGQLRKLETIQDFNSGGWLPFEMFGAQRKKSGKIF